MLPELKSRMFSRRRKIRDLTRELIAIPTENPPGKAGEQFAPVLRHRARDLGLGIDTRTPPRCVRAMVGRRDPALHFHGHYDVEPAASPGEFEPVVRGGQLFGR